MNRLASISVDPSNKEQRANQSVRISKLTLYQFLKAFNDRFMITLILFYNFGIIFFHALNLVLDLGLLNEFIYL